VAAAPGVGANVDEDGAATALAAVLPRASRTCAANETGTGREPALGDGATVAAAAQLFARTTVLAVGASAWLNNDVSTTGAAAAAASAAPAAATGSIGAAGSSEGCLQCRPSLSPTNVTPPRNRTRKLGKWERREASELQAVAVAAASPLPAAAADRGDVVPVCAAAGVLPTVSGSLAVSCSSDVLVKLSTCTDGSTTPRGHARCVRSARQSV